MRERIGRRDIALATGFALGVVVIAGVYAYRSRIETALRAPVPAAEATKATVAVLPFANLSASKDDEYFSDGITDEIIGDLSKIVGLQVAGRTSSFALKGQSLDVHKAAAMLGVRNLLEGSVRRSEGKVRIEVQLTDARSGFNLWSERYDEELSDVFRIQSEVAEQVAEKLQIKLLAGEQARVEKKPTQNLEAYNLYLLGVYDLFSLNAEGALKAREYFKRAIEKDRDFAAAYARLGDTYGALAEVEMPSREAIGRVKELETRALKIDGSLFEGHQALANWVLNQYDWNWKAAEKEFKVAMALKPSSAEPHWGYGLLLEFTGREHEALAEMQKAHELDPLSAVYVSAIGDVYYYSREYDRAIAYQSQAIEMSPNLWSGYAGRGQARFEKGDMSGAWPDLQKWASINGDPVSVAALGSYYGRGGRKEDAVRSLQRVVEASMHGFVSDFAFALAYFGIGDKERAFQYLERSYEDRSLLMVLLKGPGFDPVRSDPRFQALCKKVGLPE